MTCILLYTTTYSNFKVCGTELTEIGRCYGMEINVEKIKVIGISRQPASSQNMIYQKKLKNVQYFKYLDSMITNYAR
jgi:peroxiredoxin